MPLSGGDRSARSFENLTKAELISRLKAEERRVGRHEAELKRLRDALSASAPFADARAESKTILSPEHDLRMSAEIIEQSSHSIISTDMSGYVTSWNRGAERLFGHGASEALGMHISFVYPEKEHANLADNIIGPLLKKGSHVAEVTLLRKSGRSFRANLDLWILRDRDGKPVRMVGYATDITKARKAEEALAESEELFRQLAERSPNMIFINSMGRNVYVNEECTRVTGYPREALLAEDFDFMRLVAEESRAAVADNFRLHASVADVPPYEYIIVTKDGRRLDVINATKIISHRGNAAVLGIITDITKVKLAERRLKSSLRDKEALLQEVHHRVKNNLAIISSLFDLQGATIKDAGARKLLQESQDRIMAMALVHEHLYQSEDMVNISVAGYVRQLVNILLHAHADSGQDMDLRINVDEGITLDLDTLIPVGLVLNELITNALKYAYPGKGARLLEVAVSRQKTKCIVSVCDNGPGIPAVFAKGEGGTLGLRLVNSLVNQLRGRLKVGNKGGTNVELSFKHRSKR